MRAWVLKSGEPVPSDPGQERLLRTGLVAQTLAERGFDVVWWTSSFRHSDKQFRHAGTCWETITDKLRICFLQSRPYEKNVSLKRIKFNFDIAREFRREAERQQPPDVIFSAYPIPELAEAAGRYAKARRIPAVVDVRDLWPDVWTTVMPPPVRPIAQVGLLPFYYQSRRTLALFDGIWGITDEMVEWGLTRANRRRSKWDRTFPLAYPEIIYSEKDTQDAQEYWRKTLGGLDPPQLRLCFFGSLTVKRGRHDVMIEAMRRLPDAIRKKTQLVLCGSGPDLDYLRKLADGILEVVLPGRVTGPQIQVLALQSSVGILPYPSDLDFRRSIPNKAIEYLAHGLPILASLEGPVSRLIEIDGCGIKYKETDATDLACKIEYLLAAPSLLKQLSINAQRVFRERFVGEQVYGRLVETLEELISASRANSLSS